MKDQKDSYFRKALKESPDDLMGFLDDLEMIAREAFKIKGWNPWYNENYLIPPKHRANPDYSGHSPQQAILCILSESEDWADLAKKHGHTPISFSGKQTHI